MNTTFATIEVGNRGLSALTERVETMNARARKHGLEPVVITVLRTVAYVPLHSKGRFGQSEDLFTVAISGVEPCIAGWRMVGKIEFSRELGSMVKTLPGQEVSPKYREVGPVCQHCNTQRRRHDIFIMRHDSGEEKLVGRNCLADFLRCGDADTFARFAEFMDRLRSCTSDESLEDSEDWGCGGGRLSGQEVPTVPYLAMVSCIVRRMGWVSRTAAKADQYGNLIATADVAAMCYHGRYKHRIEFIEKNELYPTQKDYERAEGALEWAKALEGDRDEYRHNIGRLAKCANVVWKYDGFVASILSAHAKHTEQELERRERAKMRCFIGEVGVRLRDLPVRVTRLRFTEGMYGTKTIVTMEAMVGDKRAVLTWFASGDKDAVLNEGDEILVDATVKKHESDERYGDCTIVTRVTIKG